MSDVPNQGKEIGFMDDINYHRLSDSFDIPYEVRKDPDVASKMGYLSDWAKGQTKSDDRLQQIIAIKQLAKSLGLQYTGKSLVTKLYQWARLDQDRKRIEMKMEAMK